MKTTLDSIYYGIVFISLIYMLYKAGNNKLGWFIVLVFWGGLFDYISEEIIGSFVLLFYKLIIIGYSMYLVSNRIPLKYLKRELSLILFFVLFTIFYWVSHSINEGEILYDIYLYIYMFSFPLIFYFIIRGLKKKPVKLHYLKKLLLRILYIQVFLSVIKIIIYFPYYGSPPEFNVGSISYGGATSAVLVPILALILFWYDRKGKFSKIDWLIAFSFLIIALASSKRAPVFLYPALLLALFAYVKWALHLGRVLIYTFIIFIIMYLGIIAVPTLNPEKEVGGSFDVNHVTNYVLDYNFGTTELSEIYRMFRQSKMSSGRAGGLTLLFDPSRLNLNTSSELLFGKGVTETFRAYGSERFTGHLSDFGVQHVGLQGAANQVLYAMGYPALILMILFAFLIVRTINDKKIRVILFSFFLWDLFLYKNNVLFDPPQAIIIIFILFYANFIEEKSTFNVNSTSIDTKYRLD